MPPMFRSCTFIALSLLSLFALTAFLINDFFFHFIGNNYLPSGAWLVGVDLLLVVFGVHFIYEKEHYWCQVAQSILLFYAVMGAIALFTNAVQLTPFAPIDVYLVAFEKSIHINLASIVAWTASHPSLQKLLATVYDTLPYQMSGLPLMVIFCGQFSKLQEYVCFLLISALIGFGVYYFFPTTAPASIISSPFFSSEQLDTGIKFNEIHHYLRPSTMEGGLIAFPSFHVIWAWFCLYLVRGLPWVFIVILPLNTLLALSCVLLGWHYPVDLLGSVLVITMTQLISHQFKSQKQVSDYLLKTNQEKHLTHEGVSSTHSTWNAARKI